MDQRHLQSFLEATLEQMLHPWNAELLRRVAQQQLPAQVAGANQWLLDGDMRLTWLRWFVEDYVDIQAVHKLLSDGAVRGTGFGQIFSHVYRRLLEEDPQSSKADIQLTAQEISRHALMLLRRMGSEATRAIPDSYKYQLASRAAGDVRCALCGYAFREEAIDRFFGLQAERPTFRAKLVDFVRPRGLQPYDTEIQIDHIIPFSSGGETELENLQLACGWCNNAKKDNTYMYDVSFLSSESIYVRDLGLVRRPQRFWVVRTTSMIGRCENRNGCDANLGNSELFLASLSPSGALNPRSVRAFCGSHDPWFKKRQTDSAAFVRKRAVSN